MGISQAVADSVAEIFQKMAYTARDDPYVKLLNQFENIAPIQVRNYFRKNCYNITEEWVMEGDSN